MRTMKMIAIMICGVAVFAACNNSEQPAEKETIIIKEDSDREDPVVIEEKEDEGVDFKIFGSLTSEVPRC